MIGGSMTTTRFTDTRVAAEQAVRDAQALA